MFAVIAIILGIATNRTAYTNLRIVLRALGCLIWEQRLLKLRAGGSQGGFLEVVCFGRWAGFELVEKRKRALQKTLGKNDCNEESEF